MESKNGENLIRRKLMLVFLKKVTLSKNFIKVVCGRNSLTWKYFTMKQIFPKSPAFFLLNIPYQVLLIICFPLKKKHLS